MDRPPGVWYHAVRCFLAIVFLSYGGVKLANIQFNPQHQPFLFWPGPADELNGAELTWRFFGHSRVYQCLIGLAEVAAAGLLLSSRTAPLGAVMFLPVIGNVVAVDLLYGIDIDATVIALSLLAGNLTLLYADRDRLRQGVACLLRRPEVATPRWRAWLAWGLAVALIVVVFSAGVFIEGVIRGR